MIREKWVLIDGDVFRNIMGEDIGHSIEGRKRNADRICALCSFLDKQGINVLACVLSIFHESQIWLQNNIDEYKQVYIKVDYGVLKRRDKCRSMDIMPTFLFFLEIISQ